MSPDTMSNLIMLPLTRLGSTTLAVKWYLCMARTHWQMEVQALETLEMAAGWNSLLSMYGWMALITVSGMLSCEQWWERKETGDEGAGDLMEEGQKRLLPEAAACPRTAKGSEGIALEQENHTAPS